MWASEGQLAGKDECMLGSVGEEGKKDEQGLCAMSEDQYEKEKGRMEEMHGAGSEGDEDEQGCAGSAHIDADPVQGDERGN